MPGKEGRCDSERATLLHCLGPTVQHIFHMLPGDHKSLNDVKTALSGYVVAEQYKFQLRAQKADEPIDVYLTAVQEAQPLSQGTREDPIASDQVHGFCGK